MKKLYFLLCLNVSLTVLAQAPANYYNSATSTGYQLKSQLKSIIRSGHIDRGYNSLWSIYQNPGYRDAYYENNNTILDIYSENPFGTDSYEYTPGNNQCGDYNSEGDCYNREHLVPQSYFENYLSGNPMKNDPHHVVPTDGWVNGIRGNLPFGVVDIANYTSSNGSKRGSNLDSGYSVGFTGTVFEPINEFKGDVARSLLYFATRYEDYMDNFYATASTSSQAKAMFDGSTDKVFNDTFLNILISWHLADPVSAKEIAINNVVYAYQGNRNPFVDNPDYACLIWSSTCTALSINSFASTAVVLYPNPSRDGRFYLTGLTSLTSVEISNLNGQIIFADYAPILTNDTYSAENLTSGFYFVNIKTNEGVIVKKLIVE